MAKPWELRLCFDGCLLLGSSEEDIGASAFSANENVLFRIYWGINNVMLRRQLIISYVSIILLSKQISRSNTFPCILSVHPALNFTFQAFFHIFSHFKQILHYVCSYCFFVLVLILILLIFLFVFLFLISHFLILFLILFRVNWRDPWSIKIKQRHWLVILQWDPWLVYIYQTTSVS